MPKPKKRKTHVLQRFKERVGCHIPAKLIEENLDHKQIIFAKKLTNSRSLCYMIIDDTPIKFVYSKECKKVITILPIHYDFQYPKNDEWFEYLADDNKAYRIKIYPDCYQETCNRRALTKFEVWNDRLMIWKPKKNDDALFHLIYDIAWKWYEETKKVQIDQQ